MKDKVIFVTGASSGIGRAIAHRFAEGGARLALTYNRNRAEGMETKRQCLRKGAANVTLLKLDVTNGKSISTALERVKKEFGHVDVLINNAGTGVVRSFRESGLAEIEGQLRTNLEGLIKVTHAFLSLVRESIINIGSALGKETMPNMAVYCATKFGVRGFTQTLAKESPHLVICCVNPDLTATPLTGYQGRPPEAVADVVFRVASHQIGFEQGGDVDVWHVLS